MVIGLSGQSGMHVLLRVQAVFKIGNVAVLTLPLNMVETIA